MLDGPHHRRTDRTPFTEWIHDSSRKFLLPHAASRVFTIAESSNEGTTGSTEFDGEL